MAWIKLESSTLDKPEILQLSRMWGVKHGEALELCLRFWLWIDGVSVDGRVDGLVDTDVDALMRFNGFARGLENVAWLEIDNARQFIRVPNFERHNGESAKKRALKARRQSDYRSSVDARVDARVDTATSPKTPPDKIREENTYTPLQDFLLTDELRAWVESQNAGDPQRHYDYFVSYCQSKGKRYKDYRAAFRNAVRGNWAKVSAKPVLKVAL